MRCCKKIVVISMLGAVAAIGSGAVHGQAGGKKPSSKPKPAAAKTAKPAERPLIRETLGTTQLVGYEGVLGEAFTLGKNVPLNFTLRSAEFTTNRVNIGGESYLPAAGEKLLVLRYTVHNPNKTETRYDFSEMQFTVVDARDANHESLQVVGRDGTTESLGLSLKPAQKVEAFTVVKVPAAGVVPKLIVKREDNAPIVRYDLRGKTKSLPAPFADPADKSGATALAEVPAAVGQFYPMSHFDLKVDSFAFTKEPLGEEELEEGKRRLVVVCTVKNSGAGDATYDASEFDVKLRDADGEKIDYNNLMLKTSRNENAGGTLKPGEEARVRFFFSLPENLGAKTLYLSAPGGEGRVFALDVSGAK